ncbi:MAG: caspase family protein [Salinivirgaceae bacterium]|jgi:hypothetical protein|nr:caspase family protein [Salinivirgaceae bacterium]
MKPLCSHSNFTLLFTLVIIFLFPSCATIFSGANQNIKIKTEPKGAEVYINGQNTYVYTPCKVKVERRQKKTDQNKRNELNIEARKEGFENSTLNVKSSFNVISAGSIAMFGLPFLIDWAAGSHLKYNKSNYLYLAPAKTKVIEPKQVEEVQPTIVEKIEIPKKAITYSFKSDIDYDIPFGDKYYNKRFALIIGNEDYAMHNSELNENANVKYAVNDAASFKEYAVSVLGIPEDNITFLPNATLAQMKKGISKLNLFAKNSYGEAELFFYFAGHGLPHEESKKPFLIPVDVTGKDLDLAISLDDTFQKLSEYKTRKVTCFLDACFSGGSRVGDLYSSRGVKVVPKQSDVSGNMVVFAASSADQSALAYDEQKHGLFTYHLLKKFKESGGKVTYGELEEYLKKQLPLQSILINEKEQLPQIRTGFNIDENWKAWEF